MLCSRRAGLVSLSLDLAGLQSNAQAFWAVTVSDQGNLLSALAVPNFPGERALHSLSWPTLSCAKDTLSYPFTPDFCLGDQHTVCMVITR